MDLSPLGISPTEEDVYRFFLEHPNRGLPDVGPELGLDCDTVEGAVEQLERLGLLDASQCHRVRSADPQDAIEHLIEQRIGELNDEIRQVLAARATVPMLRDTQQRADEADCSPNVERVSGSDLILKRVEDLAFFCHQESLALWPATTPVEKGPERARPLDLRALRRGIGLQSVYHRKCLDDPHIAANLRDIVSLGAQVRVTENEIDWLLVYDRTVAVVPADPERRERGALLVREPGLVAQLVTHFRGIWDSAKDIHDYIDADTPDSMLSEHERMVLEALATADKDEAAARQMGVSVRTFRRYVSDLMMRLGAANRFHAALKAKEKGWM
ncbi:MAG TPA: LuxR C-terminal-related transcriptional regulator [Streptosporangiaceae bacterium]|nr:LuxR C-terminal-related transcriptional regulator [Streptosporangiaceae bacterium]